MQPAGICPAQLQTAAPQGEDEFNRTSWSQVTHTSAMSVAVRIQRTSDPSRSVLDIQER
mgnify:CR=1 FL=1